MIQGLTIDRVLKRIIGGSDRFRSNFMRLSSATFLAQVVSFASLPILTRLYAPEAFAELAIFIAFQSIFLAFATGRFEWQMPNEDTAEGAAPLLVLCLSLACLVSLGVLIAFLVTQAIFPEFLDRLYLKPEYGILLAVAVFLSALRISMYAWVVFIARLKWLAWSVFAQIVTVNICSLALGFAGYTSGRSLVISYMIGLAVGALIIITAHSGDLGAVMRVRRADVARAFHRHKYLAGTSVIVGAVNAVFLNAQVLAISVLFGPAAAGQYSVAMRVSSTPISLFTSATANSFWAETTQMVKTEPKNIQSFYIATLKRLFILAMMMSVLIFIGSFFIEWLLGDKDWDGTQYLLLATLPQVIAMTLFGPTNHLTVYEKQKYQLLSDCLGLLGAVILLYIMAQIGAPPWLAVFSASCAIALGFALRGWLHIPAMRGHINTRDAKI